MCRFPASGHVGFAAREVAKVSLLVMFPPLPRWGSPPLKLPKYHYLSCPRSCPSEARRPRSYHSIAIYRAPAPAQVRRAALKVTTVSLFRVLLPLPRWARRSRSYQSISIYCAPAPAQRGLAALGITKVSLFIMFQALPRWGSPASRLPKYCHLQCSRPCPGEICRSRSYPKYC